MAAARSSRSAAEVALAAADGYVSYKGTANIRKLEFIFAALHAALPPRDGASGWRVSRVPVKSQNQNKAPQGSEGDVGRTYNVTYTAHSTTGHSAAQTNKINISETKKLNDFVIAARSRRLLG